MEPDNQKHDAWDTLLVRLNIAAMAAAEYGIVADGAIGIRSGRIAWLGPMEALPDAPANLSADVIDCGHIWATPGLIDCHARLLQGEGGAEMAAKRLLPLLREGVTAVGIVCEHEEQRRLAEALEERLPVTVRAVAAEEAGEEAYIRLQDVAVLLPGKFYTQGQAHKPPLERLRRQHLNLALSTGFDLDASPCVSLLLMLNMGRVLFDLSPQEALVGVTSAPALALGLADAGTLAPGYLADIALWDIAHPDELSYYLGHNPCLGFFRHGALHRSKG